MDQLPAWAIDSSNIWLIGQPQKEEILRQCCSLLPGFSRGFSQDSNLSSDKKFSLCVTMPLLRSWFLYYLWCTGTRPMFIGRKQKYVHQPNWKYYLGILPKHVWKMAEFKAKQNLFYTVALDPLNPVYKSIRVILRKISPFFGYKLNYPIWGKFWNILVNIIP